MKKIINNEMTKPIILVVLFVLTMFSIASGQIHNGSIEVTTYPDGIGQEICASNLKTPLGYSPETHQVMWYIQYHDSLGVAKTINYFGDCDNPMKIDEFCVELPHSMVAIHRCIRLKPICVLFDTFGGWGKAGHVNFLVDHHDRCLRDTLVLIDMDTITIMDTILTIIETVDTVIITDIDTIVIEDNTYITELETIIEELESELAECEAQPITIINDACAIVTLDGQRICNIFVMPNPVEEGQTYNVVIDSELEGESLTIEIQDEAGRQIDSYDGAFNKITKFNGLPTGIYTAVVRFKSSGYNISAAARVVVR